MRFSSLLLGALVEEDLFEEELLLEYLDDDSISKSLNSLVKYNDGEWKSENQARFFLMKLKDFKKRYYDKKELMSWARKHGYEDKVLLPMTHSIQGYGGGRSPSKRRYWGQIFVLDGGGVVARFKVKAISGGGEGRESSINWSKMGKVTFEREGPPRKIYFDLGEAEKEERKWEVERQERVKANQKYIDLIKSIPNWEDRDILDSFMAQLEKGRNLSMSQLAIVRDLLPGKNLEIGDKKEWIKAYDEFKSLVTDKLMNIWLFLERESYKGGKESYISSGYGNEKNYDYFYPLRDDVYMDAFVKIKVNGHAGGNNSPAFDIFDIVNFLVYGDKQYKILRDADTFEDINKQYNRAIKAKRPTKKSIRVITYIMRAVKSLKKASDKAIYDAIMYGFYNDRQHFLSDMFDDMGKPSQHPKKSIEYTVPSSKEVKGKPSQKLKKAIGYTVPSPADLVKKEKKKSIGFTVPSPSKFGF